MSTDSVAADSHSPVHNSTGRQVQYEAEVQIKEQKIAGHLRAEAETALTDSVRGGARLRQHLKLKTVRGALTLPKIAAEHLKGVSIVLVAGKLSRLELDSARQEDVGRRGGGRGALAIV